VGSGFGIKGKTDVYGLDWTELVTWTEFSTTSQLAMEEMRWHEIWKFVTIGLCT